MKIHTTIRPDLELDVTVREYLDLRAQGLIAEASAPTTSEKTPAPAQGAGSIPADEKE
jgi:hypothetical protein